MSDTSLSAFLPVVRLLLLGYGHVAQAFLRLLASRSEWLGNELGVRPVISGIGTRSRGFHIHPKGIDASLLAQETDPLLRFINTSISVDDAESFIETGKDEAIAQAQELGIAEADPWYDLDGWDAVMKTTILANTLMEGQLSPHMVERKGIRDLTPDEISAAALANSPFRLVSQAHRKHGDLIAEVRPCRIDKGDILQVAMETTSVISIETEAMGIISLVEHKPTVVQTAYGILSNLVIILKQRAT